MEGVELIRGQIGHPNTPHTATFHPPRQNRPYPRETVGRPHLTVARVTRQIIAFCSSTAATVFGEWRMDSGGEKGKEGPHSEEENTKKLALEFGVGRGAGISAITP